MKTLILFFSFAFAAMAQEANYIASATTTALTLQQPATDARPVSFPQNGVAGAWITCAAAQTATLAWNGTAATATAGTAVTIPPGYKPASVSVFTGSNVGAGTTGPTYKVPAGGTINIDLSKFRMGGAGTGNNITLSATGSCTISFLWSEQ